MMGPMEFLIVGLICLVPIVLMVLAALVALAVVFLRRNGRRPVAGAGRVDIQGDTDGEAR